jgi:TolB-like protein
VIRDIDRYLNHEPLEARRDSWPAVVARFARRNRARWAAIAVCAVLVLVAAALTVARKIPLPTRSQTVAVLPLENGTADPSLDFVSVALADEISRTLSYARSLSLRPAEAARKYRGPGVDLQQAGRELRAATIVSGRFMKEGDRLQITLNLTDVEKNRRIWTDVFDAPARDTMAMQAQIASKTRRGMAPLLGVSEFVTDNPPKPKNEEAYQLYLRAVALHDEISVDSATWQQTIAMLNQSLALDPSYAPAWEALAWRYAADGWFGTGGRRWPTFVNSPIK